MTIEKTDTEIIIRLPADFEINGLELIVKYLKDIELDTLANRMADESKKRWWPENKARFIKSDA